MPYPSSTVINVARQQRADQDRWPGQKVAEHFFRIEIENPPAYCAEQIREIKKRFPKSDGFEIEVTYWKCSGTKVETNRY